MKRNREVFDLFLINSFIPLKKKKDNKTNYCSFLHLLSDFVLNSSHMINLVNIIRKC